TLVTMPLILLLLDYWPLGRFATAGPGKWKLAARLATEKLPLLLLSAASSWITVIAQRKDGALQKLEIVRLDDRVQNAVLSYAWYLKDMFWPANLSSFYPYYKDTKPALYGFKVAMASALVLAITAFVMLTWRRAPYLFVGWFWYVVSLVPMIGI